MALLRTVTNGFFKGQIFFPAEKIEITDRSLFVRFPQNGINNDSNAVAEGQGVGWIPSRRGHRVDDFLLGSDERNVEWITWDIACRLRHARAVIEHGMSHFIALPKARKNQVSHCQISEGDAERDSRPGREQSLFLCVGSRHSSANKPRFAANAYG